MPAWVATTEDIFGAFGRELAQFTLRGPRARESWKAVVSVLLGLMMSFLIFDADDAFWAAFGAFMVLRASVAETMTRGLYRVLGTVAGALIGFFFAGIAANNAGALLLGMMCVGFVSIFHFQTSRYSYAWMYFGLTAELVLTITLGAPQEVTPFVALRVGEIVVGVAACIVTSCVFEVIWPVAEPNPPAPPKPPREPLSLWRGLFNEDWMQANRLPLIHAARGAVAFAVLFFFWRVIELSSFSDSAVTSYMVLMLPAAPIREGKDIALTDRGMQRFVGCVLGGAFALASLLVVNDHLQMWVIALSAGVWIAAWVQNGREGASYAGSQFALVLLVTFVQSNGPPTNLLPAWQRFQGILIGVFALGLVQAAWPLPAPKSIERKA
jgi:uncharacterized membrane protein YccC